jgi:hypothetical protein
MYVNSKMIPVEAVPGIRGEGMKESSGNVNSNVMYLIHCKNFCKYSNVPPPSTIKKQNHQNSRYLNQ